MKDKLPPNVLRAPNGPVNVHIVMENRSITFSERNFREFVRAQGVDDDAVVAELIAGGFEQRFMPLGEGTPYVGPPELVLYAEAAKISPAFTEWFNQWVDEN